jgi:hypothetical protein
MDYQRAVQAYLWAYAAVSFESIRLAAIKPQWPLVFDLIDDPVEEWDLIEKRLDFAWVLAPVAGRLGALAQSAARYPNIKPGEEFEGYGKTTSKGSESSFPLRVLHGAKNYRLNIPANAPAKDFWSLVVYDPQTRSELQTSQPYPSKYNKRDQLIGNADGSVDLYFGPKAPQGKEANWTQTAPGKSWFAILRVCGPLNPWFDKTWRPGEIEEVD